MRIPDSIIESVRERVDIVQVVGRHVQLKRAGRNHLGLCPFHNEKTPSFNVSADRKSWHCFGCGEGGNVFTFLTRLQGKPFPEVLKELAREVGVEVPERDETPEEKAHEALRQRLFAVQERALAFFLEQLKGQGGSEARSYLAERGLDEKRCAEFEIGFAGVGRDPLWRALGTTEQDRDDLVKAGLCVVSDRGPYDRFFGRVVFPIRDEKFRVIGFGGRVFGERARKEGVAKYLNSSESAVYDKSRVLYRLPQAMLRARKGQPVVIVEGYFDALALEGHGLAAVASCGTALTPKHGAILQRLGVPVVMCWDGDAAGEKAVQRAAEVLLPLKIDTRIAALPTGDDPDTYVARTGPGGAARLVEEAEELPKWVIAQVQRLVEDAGDDVPKRVAAVRSLGWLFQALPVGLERDLYLEQAARSLSLQPAQLAREIKLAHAPAPAPVAPAGPRPQPPRAVVARPPSRLSPEERILLRLVMEHPEKAAALLELPLPQGLHPMVLPFLAFVREKVQEGGPFDSGSPVFATLDEHVPHPEAQAMLAEVRRGQRVYPDAEAVGAVLSQFVARLERTRLKQRRQSLLEEAAVAQQNGDADAYQRLRVPLKEVTDALRLLEQGTLAAAPESGTQS